MADIQTSLPLLIVRPSILNPVMHFSTQPLTGEMKYPIGYTFALHISFYLLQCSCNTCTNHIITWPCWFIDLDLTCFSPLPSSIGSKSCSSFTATRSIAPKPPTFPSRLQLVYQAKSCLDLLHLSHMTQCHVPYAMRSFITCVSFATSPSHFHLHGICCSHTCTCGLITCVSHINTISPPRLSFNYQNHIGIFQSPHFL